jgi:hypothetical protein
MSGGGGALKFGALKFGALNCCNHAHSLLKSIKK